MLKKWSLLIFVFASLVSIIFKLYISQIGYNPDSESWWLVKEAVTRGSSVYVSTHRYNYGPIWSYVLSILGHLTEGTAFSTIQGLHYFVAWLLGMVDVILALVLYVTSGLMISVLYLLSPTSLLLSGYHSQFDNLAVLFGIFSYLMYLESYKPQRYAHARLLFFISALVLGVSLSTKHILFLFPIWLFLNAKRDLYELFRHVLYAVLAYLVFFAYFVQEILLHWSFRAGILNGIKLFVIDYKGSYGVSALLKLLSVFFPVDLIDRAFASTPIFKGYMFFFVVLMLLVGILFGASKMNKKNLLVIYLLSFFALSSSMADQYIAIALVPLAIFFANPVALFAQLVSYLYLSGVLSANFGGLIQFPLMLGVYSKLVGMFPWDIFYRFDNLSAQAWFLALLVGVFIAHFLTRSHKFTPMPILVNLAAFIMIFLVMFLNINLAFLLYTRYAIPNSIKINVLDIEDDNICADMFNQEVQKQCNGKYECVVVIDLPDCSDPYSTYWKCTQAQTVYPVHFVQITPQAGSAQFNISCKSRFFY